MLKLFALRRLRVEQLLVGAVHFRLFAIVAHVVSGTVRVVGHVIRAERLTIGTAGARLAITRCIILILIVVVVVVVCCC